MLLEKYENAEVIKCLHVDGVTLHVKIDARMSLVV